MRTSSRLAVGSPTLRVAAIMVATLLLALAVAGASFAGSRLFAAEGPIVVDHSGGGDYATITEAVASAKDGDEIHVRPGTYVEAVTIDKDITLTGEGPVEDIVIQAPEEGPTALTDGAASSAPHAMLLVDTSAELTNLTSSGEPSAVLVHGGSPTLDGLVLEGVGTISFEAGNSFGRSSVAISDGSTAVIRNSIVRNGGSITASGVSTPRIEGNMLVGGPHVALLSVGDGTTVISNSIDGSLSWAIGAFSPGAVVIEGNIIINPGADGAVSL